MSTDTSTASDGQSLTTSTVEEVVRRARSLYTLPAVAAEVIQLTDSPKVDARALKECIERDPALTAKVLRVVNSSLFGLSREVSDLNQALALLGTKPLKLLVLGFSLPENLFRNVAREQLAWYWSTTLARAVAAREISETLFKRPGDEPFLAGLLQDIGILVLLGQLQEPYAEFLSQVIDQQADLNQAEQQSLGFDHTALSVSLLEHWHMPRQLVQAIAAPRRCQVLAKQQTTTAHLSRVLHLATLLAELVGQNRLRALPELMEVGEVYCGLDKPRLNSLVEELQPKVAQLADVLSLDAVEETDYMRVLTEAHQQMSELVESVAGPLSPPQYKDPPETESATEASVFGDAVELRAAVESFLKSSEQARAVLAEESESNRSSDVLSEIQVPAHKSVQQEQAVWQEEFTRNLTMAVGACRSKRQPLSVVMLEISGPGLGGTGGDQVLEQLLEAACREESWTGIFLNVHSPKKRTLVFPNCDRQEALHITYSTFRHIEKSIKQLAEMGRVVEGVVSAGVASVALPPRNFAPLRLLETAERCLAAARTSETNVVKSLEIY